MGPIYAWHFAENMYFLLDELALYSSSIAVMHYYEAVVVNGSSVSSPFLETKERDISWHLPSCVAVD